MEQTLPGLPDTDAYLPSLFSRYVQAEQLASYFACQHSKTAPLYLQRDEICEDCEFYIDYAFELASDSITYIQDKGSHESIPHNLH